MKEKSLKVIYYLQLKLRLRKSVQHRQTYLKSKNADVSPEAQELYRVFAKQYNKVWTTSETSCFL